MLEEQIRFLCILCFLIIGLSHLLQPQSWIDFFKRLLSFNKSGAFINGFITLPLGVLIVTFHNVWWGIPVILTLMGWLYLVKATICFCFPAISLKSMKRVENNNLTEFRIAGIIFLIIATVLSVSLLQVDFF